MFLKNPPDPKKSVLRKTGPSEKAIKPDRTKSTDRTELCERTDEREQETEKLRGRRESAAPTNRILLAQR